MQFKSLSSISEGLSIKIAQYFYDCWRFSITWTGINGCKKNGERRQGLLKKILLILSMLEFRYLFLCFQSTCRRAIRKRGKMTFQSLTGVLSQCREAAREYIGGMDGFRRFFQEWTISY